MAFFTVGHVDSKIISFHDMIDCIKVRVKEVQVEDHEITKVALSQRLGIQPFRMPPLVDILNQNP